MPRLSDFATEARITAQSLADFVGGRAIRLGVTGLSRAGKTVFITAFVQNLLARAAGGEGAPRLPVLRVHAEGRLTKGLLQPQPDDAVPRFAYEDYLAALAGGETGADRHWPESTRRIAELRLTLEFERVSGWRSGSTSLSIDIVDYPGEWLLDLPLLGKSFAQWSRETLDASAQAARAPLAAAWRGMLTGLDPKARASEDTARRLAETFTAYLAACRDERVALSTLPPGRFLMPGDLEGSPALTFSPLSLDEGDAPAGSLAATMARRYEAYKTHVVRPFFRDHFARLDRQIVLVDALSALNSGPAALRDLETAMADVLTAFRVGRGSLVSTLFRPRIDRILFAATKADRLHHTSHDRLEAILRILAGRAIARAEGVGARIDVVALAAIRATREATVRQGRDTLPAIVGIPEQGERVGDEVFDGQTEAAIYPGELTADPKAAFRGDAIAMPPSEADYRFLRFRPPVLGRGSDGAIWPAPHIRLDRAIEFLLGDRLS